MHFGVIEGPVISLCQASNRLGMFINRCGPMGWGESVVLVRHNLSIMPPAEHNFKHMYSGFKGDARRHNTIFFEHHPTDSNLRECHSVEYTYLISWLSATQFMAERFGSK